MGVKVFKNQEGEVMVQGIPAGYWVFVTFGVLIMIVGLIGSFAGSYVGGFITTAIGIIILLCGKKYGNSRRQKKVNEYYKKENQLKAEEQQREDEKDFEEFKKWKNSQKDDVQK